MAIGELFHVVHVVKDLPQAEAWYEAVFSPQYMFRGHESELDLRTASMMLFADFPAEPMMPYPGPLGEQGTIGKFHRRFGQRLHSLAFYCDSIADGYERFRSFGVRVSGDGGATLNDTPTRGGIYTHPRDTFGLIELMEPRIGGRGGAPVGDSLGECYDPRLLGTHDASWWTDQHPLHIVRTSHISVLVDNLDRAVRLYEQTLFGTAFHETSCPRGVFLAVGTTTVIELRCTEPGTAEAELLAKDGPMIWSVTFLVNDLEAATDHLAAVGVSAASRGRRLVIDPGSALGGRYEFADEAIPADPRR